MIAALSKGYQALGDRAYADAARKAADFILKNLRTGDGRLLRRYRNGDAAYAGYLDDYAFMVWGLIELYEATFEVTYLEAETLKEIINSDLVTKRDLVEAKVEIIKWVAGMLVAQAAIVATLVKLL